MATSPYGDSFRFDGQVADFARDFSVDTRTTKPGPPLRIDGYTFGAIPHVDGPGPHGGELHPDGDELLYVVSGRMEVILDDGDKERVGVTTTVVLEAGDAFVVPRGVWHRAEAVEPSYLIHVTPGPGSDFRPRSVLGE